MQRIKQLFCIPISLHSLSLGSIPQFFLQTDIGDFGRRDGRWLERQTSGSFHFGVEENNCLGWLDALCGKNGLGLLAEIGVDALLNAFGSHRDWGECTIIVLLLSEWRKHTG